MLLQGRQGAERAAARLACAIQDMIRVLLVLLQGLRGAERFVVDKTLEGVRLQHSVVLPLALPLCDVPGSHPMLQHGEKGAERAAARWACEVLRVLLVLLQGPRIAEHFVTDRTLEIVPPRCHGGDFCGCVCVCVCVLKHRLSLVQPLSLSLMASLVKGLFLLLARCPSAFALSLGEALLCMMFVRRAPYGRVSALALALVFVLPP